MRFDVRFTVGAERDLEEIHDYIAHADSAASADHVLEQLQKLCSDLASFPLRGSHPPALAAIGIRDFRQVAFKAYLVVYRVVDRTVFIHLVAGGRRDMQALLARRLLAG